MPEFPSHRGYYDRFHRKVDIKDATKFFEYWRQHELKPLEACSYEETNNIHFLFEMERALYEAGRPYYKIWPEFLQPLADTSLAVPAEYFKLPYSCFEIRLSKESMSQGTICLSTGEPVSSIWISDWNPTMSHMVEGGADTLIQSWYECRPDFPRGENPRVYTITMHTPDIEIDEETTGGPFERQLVGLVDGHTIEECVAATARGGDQSPAADASDERRVLRLAFTLSALITGHDRLIEPDILSSDFDKFRQAKTQEEITRLHERATNRRGEGRGHTVGRCERLLDLSRKRRDEEYARTGRELEYSHHRRGHLHGYHTNSGYVIKWLPTIIVKPDKPLDPRYGRGVQVR